MINITTRKIGGDVIATLIRGDNATTAIRINVPERADGVDLSGLSWAVLIRNAAGGTDVYVPAKAERDGHFITFDWFPGGVATAAAGLTEVMISGTAQADDPPVWQSATYCVRVDEKVDADPAGDDAQKLTELQQLIVFVQSALPDVIDAGRAAQEAANRANEAAKRVESIEGIVIDETLTQPGAAADAAAVGGKLDKLSEEMAFDYAAYGLPIVYLTGDITGMDKDNAVSMQYVYGDKSGECEVKWQGTSSLNYPKKNYTIKFDNAFEAVEGWGEQKKYCLKAYYIDYSHLRDRVGAIIWGAIAKRNTEVTWTNALPNCGAVAGFPCMVVINGEYMGLYSFNTPKDPWLFGFADNDVNCAIVGMAKDGNVTRFKAPTVFSDSGFEYEHLADGVDEATMTTQFGGIYTAIQNSENKSNCYSADCLNSRISVLNVIQHFIFAVVFSHRDGIGKNTLFVTNDGGAKWTISEYDMDSTLGNNVYGDSYINGKDQTFANYANTSKLFEVVYKYDKSRVIAQYKNLRKVALLEATVANTILNEGAKIPKAVLDYETKLWPGIPGTNTNNVNQMLLNFREHIAQCDAEIEAMEASLAES